MAKAKINTGHGRHARTKTGSPAKPAPTKVRTGFQALSGLNSGGSRQAIPHTSGAQSQGGAVGYQWKLDLAGVGRKGGGRRMF